jgi:putative DNA-invertase from lambdoid prophage Rac
MKVVIYSRVSTTEQTVDNQVQVLESWAQQRGFELLEVYKENESAWRNGHQKELTRLVSDARKREFDTVLVWSLDRLSREGAAKILNIINTLGRYEVKVLSYQEPWTEAPGELSELLFAIAGWVARMESQRRSERTIAGLARVRAQGKRLGRPPGSRDKRKRRRRQKFTTL